MANTKTARQISAIDITDLWYGPTSTFTGDITPATLKTALGTMTKLANIHQDTWAYEEAEAQQDTYRNQLTGLIYREGRRTPGDETVKFTIGKYDFIVKQQFFGGELIEEGDKVVGWKKTTIDDTIRMAIVFKTVDNVYGVFSFASVKANHANTDKAVGLAVTGTAMENDNAEIKSVYWIDGDTVTAAA